MPPTGVYCICNLVSGKKYVGSSSTSLVGRIRHHLKELRGRRHQNKHLQSAWNTYGPKAFRFSILEYCEPEDCLAREQHWIDKLNTFDRNFGYNSRSKAGSNFGMRWSEETRKKISAAQVGKKLSLETKEKMKKSQMERWAKPGAKLQQSARMRGVKKSTTVNMSLCRIGKKLGRSHKAAIAARFNNPEFVSKFRSSLKAAWVDPAKKAARIAKMRATRKANSVSKACH